MSRMPGASKRDRFIFERVFAERPLNSGLMAAAAGEEPGTGGHSDAMLERARREGFEQGAVHGREAAFKEAIAAAQQSLEKKAAETLSSIETQIGEMLQAQSATFGSLITDGERILHTIIQRLMPELARRGEIDEIIGVVRLGMSIACNDPVLEVRVAPPLVDRVKAMSERAAKSANFPGRIEIEGDSDLAPGATRVRWTHGSAARDPYAALATIEAILNSHLGIETAFAEMAALSRARDHNDQQGEQK
jgi:flagellar biosynthesis/type III secretory pathway protein FliH